MVSSEILNLFTEMKDLNILFTYSGMLSQDILVDLGQFIKTHVSEESIDKKKMRKLFGIFIELAQNISKYSLEKKNDNDARSEGIGIIILWKQEGFYNISAANLMSRKSSEVLTQTIGELNELSPESLKERYKQQIKLPLDENATGAGLGLIDIMRKSGEPMDFKVMKPVDDLIHGILTAQVAC